MENLRLNKIFKNMKQRCYNPCNSHYKDYGARGITICNEWLENPKTFRKWALTHGYRSDLTIDRIDNSKGYSPENCRWVTRKEQASNRRSNHLITYMGITQNLSQWCNSLGLSFSLVQKRINQLHWSIDKAFETPTDADYRLITYKGKTQSLASWCRELCINYKTMQSRLRSGWSIERAFETKKRG